MQLLFCDCIIARSHCVYFKGYCSFARSHVLTKDSQIVFYTAKLPTVILFQHYSYFCLQSFLDPNKLQVYFVQINAHNHDLGL